MFRISLIFLAVVVSTLGSFPPFISDEPFNFFEDINLKTFSLKQLVEGTRLPTNVIPIGYNVLITPLLEDMAEYKRLDAPGIVEIKVKVTDIGVNQIRLHASKSTITVPNTNPNAVKVKGPENAPVEVVGIDHPVDSDKLTINLGSELSKDAEYIITIPFKGSVSDGTTGISGTQEGLYLSSYEEEGVTKYLATTQFEAIGARKAFPCFDEPALRATFQIRIGRGKSFMALSNTEKFSTEAHPDSRFADYQVDTFKLTPLMPSYLIALHVSQYTSIPSTVHPQSVKIWGPPNQMSEATAQFSADASAKIRDFFTEYFKGDNTGDPIPKLDSVAVPHFPAGAMENWGLNNYRVPTLLFTKDMTQFELWRQSVVIAHEVAHIWFGNLVTINWWNELWVKEGLARFLQYIGVEGAEPRMKAMERFTLDTIQVAMENDLTPATHAIWRDIKDELPTSNARIIYEKGASLMRMVEGFLTTPILKKGMISFLNKFKGKSATQEQLLGAINEFVPAGTLLPDQSVGSIMESWTTQNGFPLLRVSRGGDQLVYISQEKYFGSDDLKGKEVDGTGKWDIPITFTSKAEPIPENYKAKAWIRPKVLTTEIKVNDANSWILLNPNAMSYYRVLYEVPMVRLLKEQLVTDHTVFSLSSRVQLLDDYFNFADHSYASLDTVLDLTTYLENETYLAVWTTALKHIRKIFLKSAHSPHFESLKRYIGSLISQRVSEIEANPPANGNTEPVAWMLRSLLLNWACVVELPECMSTTNTLVDQWIQNPAENPIQADIQATLYCAVHAYGSAEARTFLKAKYSEVKQTPKQKELLVAAQGCETDEEKLKSVLSHALDPELPENHKKLLLGKLAENTVAQKLIIEFLSTHLPALPNIDETLIFIFNALGTTFSTEAHVQEVKNFLNKFPDLSAKVKETIEGTINTIEKNRKWNKDNYHILNDWLSMHNFETLRLR